MHGCNDFVTTSLVYYHPYFSVDYSKPSGVVLKKKFHTSETSCIFLYMSGNIEIYVLRRTCGIFKWNFIPKINLFVLYLVESKTLFL